MEDEKKEKNILEPLHPIKNLLVISKGGAQPILLDTYDEYLNMPLKLVKMTDLVNYLDIFEKYHSTFPNQKKVLNTYLKIDEIILGFNEYLSDFGTNELEKYFLNSNTGKVLITLKEYIKYLFIMNPQYAILPFEYVPSDAGKKRVLRFLNKLNVVFEQIEKDPNYKDNKIKFIVPYYLDYIKFLEENQKYKNNLKKCKGILICNDLNKNINYEKIMIYKQDIDKIKKELEKDKEKDKDKDNEEIMLIKSSSDSIVDLIVGILMGCTHYEISFPHVYAQDGKCLDINFGDYKSDKNYGNLSDVKNFDFEPNLLDMNDIKYLNETINITEGCQCFCCLTGYKRSYLYHLFKCKELNGPIITSIHNYFQVRELYEKLNELKDNESKLNNFIMWFLTTQCKNK
jgi:hypothetical protein